MSGNMKEPTDPSLKESLNVNDGGEPSDGALAPSRPQTKATGSNATGVVIKQSTLSSIQVFVFVVCFVAFSVFLTIQPPPVQAIFAFVFVGLGVLLWLIKGKEFVRHALVIVAAVAALRYIVWRTLYTIRLDDWVVAIVSILLYLAELYSVVYALFAFFQTWVMDRSIGETPPDYDYNPSVDVFIPTYNEPLDILKRTISAASSMDYPNKQVYVLDDGHRPEMRELCQQLGCNYIDREGNEHAKAGNINHALPLSKGEFIAFLDADHVPVASFIRRTILFFKDPDVAFIQTPYRHINVDPISRNLFLEGELPHEQELFFQVVQVGNNHWNASFFCGTAGIFRRSHLLEIGGMATQTVIEDSHTALKLHAAGRKSVYFPVSLVAGLSPESFGAFILQRCRWARGNVQIIHHDNPIWKKGLTLPQRFCYINTILYFFCGLPRLVFFLAPLSYLVFNILPLNTLPGTYLQFIVPYLLLVTLASNYQYGNFRHTFWSEVYEAILAPYMAFATTHAFFNKKAGAGKFDVTPKGDVIDRPYFNFQLGWPMLVLMLCCMGGVVAFPGRYLAATSVYDQQVTCANEFWNIYNFVILMAAIWIAFEQPQRRKTHRVARSMPVTVRAEGLSLRADGRTQDMTEHGSSIEIAARGVGFSELVGQTVSVMFKPESEYAEALEIKATIRSVKVLEGDRALVGVEFVVANQQVSDALVRLAYCEPGTWTRFHEPHDSPLHSLLRVAATPFRVARKSAPRMRK